MEAHTSQTYTGSAEDELQRATEIGTAAFPCFAPKPSAAPLKSVGRAFTNQTSVLPYSLHINLPPNKCQLLRTKPCSTTS